MIRHIGLDCILLAILGLLPLGACFPRRRSLCLESGEELIDFALEGVQLILKGRRSLFTAMNLSDGSFGN